LLEKMTAFDAVALTAISGMVVREYSKVGSIVDGAFQIYKMIVKGQTWSVL
jgi:hypothetical protein